jgi:hypothetical protein
MNMVSSLDLDISRCIDAGLDTIGASSKKVVYWYLSQKCNLNREDVPENPLIFLDALKTIFGQGAGILERTIMRELKKAFDVTLGESLAEVLSLIKRKGSSSITANHFQGSSAKSRLED